MLNQFLNLQSESADSYLAQVSVVELDQADYREDYHRFLDEQDAITHGERMRERALSDEGLALFGKISSK